MADRTPKKDWKPAFVRELTRTGNVSASAAKAKVGRRTAYDARAADIGFAQAWDEAIEISVELLEAEARRRAHDGTLRPVFQQGELVGKVREYSDTLMIFLLKAHKPNKYRDNARVEIAGDPARPVQVNHAHGVSLTPDDVALARSLLGLGAAGDGVPADGGLPPA